MTSCSTDTSLPTFKIYYNINNNVIYEEHTLKN